MPRTPHPQVADQDETVDDLLRTSAGMSGSVPIRQVFVQQGPQRDPAPGPLSQMLRAHDERSLDLFMIHRAVASADPWDVTRDARVWERVLSLTGDADDGATAVSKAWRRLDEQHGLVLRERGGRLAKITALREDGLGWAYTYPNGSKRDERYFKLPFRAKAMLLVSLSLPAGFVLPTQRVPGWYGISADSTDRSLRELDKAVLLRREIKVKKAPKAPLGIAREYHHTLLAPFVQRRLASNPTRLRVVS